MFVSWIDHFDMNCKVPQYYMHIVADAASNAFRFFDCSNGLPNRKKIFLEPICKRFDALR